MAAPTPAQDIIDLINDQITDNGGGEITAAVLRPVLLAMVNQINGLVGDLNDLVEGTESVIQSINTVRDEVGPAVSLFSGVDDPNDTPPGGSSIGDFYQQTDGGANTIGFFQYNGNDWAPVRTIYEAALRGIATVSDSYVVQDSDNTVVYTGTDNTDTIQQPTAADHPGRIIKAVNQHNQNINWTIDYIGKDKTSKPTILANSTISIQSNGADWYEI